jgi:hypothetical protein
MHPANVYPCCDDRRRERLLALGGTFNSIDFLEVFDSPELSSSLRQRRLFVHFLFPIAAPLSLAQFVISGGDRIRAIGITAVAGGQAAAEPLTGPPFGTTIPAGATIATLAVDQAGDFSEYELRLRTDANTPEPPPGFDPVGASVTFRFKALCPTDRDCGQPAACTEAPPSQPTLDYLTKDYTGFRTLMLDRLATLLPNWSDRNAADPGVALVELLAHTADLLSARADAVATEAYLNTARERTSVRRHARLIGYTMDDGRNARVWAQIVPANDTPVAIPVHTPLVTRIPGLPVSIPRNSDAEQTAVDADEAREAVWFETMHDLTARSSATRVPFYTWGRTNCCLPAGSTQATLDDPGRRLVLEAGDVLILAQTRDPATHNESDADPRRRHAIRLTGVQQSVDPLFAADDDPTAPRPLLQITWDSADALPFALWLGDADAPLAHALGNIVLADHGRWLAQPRTLGTVPAPEFTLPPTDASPCDLPAPTTVPARFRPKLFDPDITRVSPPPDRSTPARLALDPSLAPEPPRATAQLRVESTTDAQSWEPPRDRWEPTPDLLDETPTATRFVPELNTDGSTTLRFGDDQSGRAPNPGESFRAFVRTGSGERGNIGPASLAHILINDTIAAVTNPLPGIGGRDPDPVERTRRTAPHAFRRQRRAVTPADYAARASAHPSVQRAAATLRWTGSWKTVFVTIDPLGGGDVTPELESTLRQWLEPYRLAGHDLEIDAPSSVGLVVGLRITVAPTFSRDTVLRDLTDRFTSGLRADGTPGPFHPDRLTLGQPVYSSVLISEAMNTPGVDQVVVTEFHRFDDPTSDARDDAVVRPQQLEILRLDNDPNYPERGRLRFTMEGGR